MSEVGDLKDRVQHILESVRDQLKENDFSKMTILSKSDRTDLVTSKDKDIEKFINMEIKKYYPDCKIVSEEGFGDNPKNLEGLVFFVDPIDGTLNFVKGHDNYASMIAVYLNGLPILGAIMNVAEDILYIGGPRFGVLRNGKRLKSPTDVQLSKSIITISSRLIVRGQMTDVLKRSMGLRIFGSAGIIFGRILDGKQGAYISRLSPWDVAAGKILCETLGIPVIGVDGKPINMLQSQVVVTGTKQLVKEVLEVLN